MAARPCAWLLLLCCNATNDSARVLVLQWLAANGGSWPVCFGQDWAEIARLPHIGYGSAHMYQSMQ